MDRPRLFLDMDGTLARFHDQVNYLERMYEKDFFRSLGTFENMVAGVRQFIQSHPEVDVYILSAKVLGEPPYCEMEKHAWLDQHLPEIDAAHRIFTDMGRPKAEYIPGGLKKSDFLLDDYNRGLNQWLYDGGTAIKCHNNINQRGLGTHGGQRGNLWVGPMVHVQDHPQLIAAELASHMGLEYDLSQVLTAYPDISLGGQSGTLKGIIPAQDGTYSLMDLSNLEPDFSRCSNPLNGIRYLTGHPEFEEIRLGTLNDPIYIPLFRLRDICFNDYHDPNFEIFWESSPQQFSKDIQMALEDAKKPIVGQIEYLSTNGRVGDLCIFHSVEAMKKEIEESEGCGRPISVTWNIILPVKPLWEMDFFELADKLYYEYNQGEAHSSFLAHALLKLPSERSREEVQALIDFWHNAVPSIKGHLNEFLGITEKQIIPSDTYAQFFSSAESQGLDEIIQQAEGRQQVSSEFTSVKREADR